MKNAIILCSGGIDSVTTAYYVKKKLKHNDILILFFDYGQKSLRKERECARRCARDIKGGFREIRLKELGKLSTSLINKKGKIRKLSKKDLKDTKKESEKWYVPNRNTIFLTYAVALAESIFLKEKKINGIFVGFKCEGKDSYPDTTKEFVDKINKLSGKFKVRAPLINKDKEDIVLLGEKLGVDFGDTFSCYIGKKEHCGYCLACKLRQEGFYWANVRDPTKYEVKK